MIVVVIVRREDSGYILQGKPMRFTNGLDMDMRERRVRNYCKVVDHSN